MEQDINYILRQFGLREPFVIKQIYGSAWQIDDSYIIKKNNQINEMNKAIIINSYLKKEGFPVAEYVKTISGDYFAAYERAFYSLMHKIKGTHLDPFSGDYINIAHNIGIEIAKLHKALKKLEENIDVYNNDLMDELNGWILSEIKNKNIEIPDEIICFCLEFDESYHSLPRQLIHRDIHLGNMLFENDTLSGFLDFDISQKNARIFDIIYFIQSKLVDKYKDNEYVERWGGFVNSFLRGYHSENPLYENEIKAIHKFSVAIQLIFIAFFSSINKTDLVSNSLEMAKWVFLNEKVFTFSLSSE